MSQFKIILFSISCISHWTLVYIFYKTGKNRVNFVLISFIDI